MAAGDYNLLMQVIEGSRTASLQWGTANAIPAVLRFNASTTVLNRPFCVAIRNATASHSIVFNFNGHASSVNAWKTFSVAIPACTVGTWPTDTAASVTVAFVGTTGSTYQTTAGAWQAGNFLGTSTIPSFPATSSSFIYVTDVGLYADPLGTGRAPPWSMVPNGDAFKECLRYWCKNQSMRGVGTGGASHGRAGNPYMTPMRTNATLTVVGAVYAWTNTGSATLTGAMVNYANPYYAEADLTANAALTARNAVFHPQDNNPAIYVASSARM